MEMLCNKMFFLLTISENNLIDTHLLDFHKFLKSYRIRIKDQGSRNLSYNLQEDIEQ